MKKKSIKGSLQEWVRKNTIDMFDTLKKRDKDRKQDEEKRKKQQSHNIKPIKKRTKINKKSVNKIKYNIQKLTHPISTHYRV